MNNNKGFTLVELLVSFTLSMILVIIMFQLIINLKELYMSSGLKTELLNKQYLMTNKIYTDLLEKKLIAMSSCENIDHCIDLTFSDSTVKRFYIDIDNEYITYDDYTIKLNNNSYFEDLEISITSYIIGNTNDRILNIKVPIYNDLFKNTDFGINIIYPYNSSEVTDTYN